MAKLNFYLDTRRGANQLKLRIYHNGEQSYYNTCIEIDPKYWDDDNMMVTRHRFASLYNQQIDEIFHAAHEITTDLIKTSRINNVSASDIRDLIREHIAPENSEDNRLFIRGYVDVMMQKDGRNREIYDTALKRIVEFITNSRYVCTEASIRGMTKEKKAEVRKQFRDDSMNDPKVKTIMYDDIDLKWLQRFDAHLQKNSPSVNARGIIFRCMRHVFKNAILYGYTTKNPFDFFKIRREETVHRSMTTPELRAFMSYEVEEQDRFHHDMFRLIFMLIGINAADLCQLQRITPAGRIEYSRQKTHRLYSIKVEPEAQVIIDRWKGSGDYLLCCLDRYSDVQNFIQFTNRHLQNIGPYEWVRSPKFNHLPEKKRNPLHPQITTYWARHSWATIAAELDIPKEVISAALGHSMGSRVTAVYINFDQEKVDIANRLVLDWILYRKYTSWYKAMEENHYRKEQERVEASSVTTITQQII